MHDPWGIEIELAQLKREQPHPIMPEGRQVRLKTQLGGILNLRINLENQISFPLKMFLSLWKRNRHFSGKTVILITKSPSYSTFH